MAISTNNPNQLAHLAGCYSPDSFTSPGAEFLVGIADAVTETIEYGYEDASDSAHEIADNAVPVYTHARWQTFVDLGAYEQDISELGADTSDLTQAAAVALYMIAQTLAETLFSEHEDSEDQ